jgi:hypothetical protein
MRMKDYFETKKGFGVLATADKKGMVDAAIYSRPHFITPNTLAFIMADKLSHANLKKNPYAVYIFQEAGPGYKGLRLYIKKTKEEKNSPLIPMMRRHKSYCPCTHYCWDKFLVYFRLLKTLPLVGAK